jgi:hypothetical protein
MNREDVQKLLGGYATGTLTPEERQALFAAALDDQELFDALAREQSLRDLLRDPAAKAQVLVALDAAPDAAPDNARVPWHRYGWWRPAAVAAAMAGIAVMVVVVTRKQDPPPAAERVVAQNRGPVGGGQGPGAEPGAPMARRTKPLVLPNRKPAAKLPELPAPPMVAAAPLPTPAETPSIIVASGHQAARRLSEPARFSTPENLAVRAEQMPRPIFRQPGQQLGQQLGQQPGQPGLRDSAAGSGGALQSRFLAANARLLFYGNPVAADAIGEKKAAKTTAANGTLASAGLTAVPAFHLGVRCSILRKQSGGETVEVGIETVLDAGEPIKLRIVPNDRGVLRVWEPGPNGGLRTVASGTAQPLQPFEVSLPDYALPGGRQLYVQFTRDGQAALTGAAPQSALLTLVRADLIQTVADEPEKATYVVNRFSDPATQQVLVPITLNYKQLR